MEEEDRSLTVAAPGPYVVSAYRFLDLWLGRTRFGEAPGGWNLLQNKAGLADYDHERILVDTRRKHPGLGSEQSADAEAKRTRCLDSPHEMRCLRAWYKLVISDILSIPRNRIWNCTIHSRCRSIEVLNDVKGVSGFCFVLNSFIS